MARVTKRYRRDAAFATQCAVISDGKPEFPERIPVVIEFRPADRRRRDMDGMLSRLKAGLDGIADALGVDDSRFDLTLKRRPTCFGGRVIVEVTHG